MNKMKLRKVLVFSVVLTFFMISCETDFKYQKIKIDSKNKTVEILSNDFVLDSIDIGNYKTSFYNLVLLKKDKGTNIVNLTNPKNDYYRCNINNLGDMCKDLNFNSNNGIDIFIRSKKYSGKSLSVDRDKVQRFNISYLPCDNKVVILDAIRRH